jgi:hypothetical protein
MVALSSRETGHPALARFAISVNFAASMPGIFATTVRWLAVIVKPSASFSNVMAA